MAATPTTTSEFLELLSKSGLLTEEQVQDLDDLPAEPTACAAALIAKGTITKFQAKLLLNGRYKGFKLGPYIIREQIGQGGMGAVYHAEHETLRRRVALKVLTLPKEGNAKLSIERFLREARAAAALDHPNIVRLHDVGKDGGTHYIVMEFVEGQTLDQIISRSGSISSSRAVEYIAMAAAGLQHAYEKGFIHRDIKPGNLMLTKDGCIKILDMGLARTAETSEADKLTEVLDKGAVVGTADFISPEQAMNGKLDIRSDIYSLGATFFALVTGHAPFTGNTTQKLIQHQMKEAPSLITIDRTFPPGLSVIVARMLAKKAENRYQAPADVIHALAEWIPQQASGKMSAAISGTDLATSEEMQTTLSEIASGGTKRLASRPRLNPERGAVVRARWFWPAVAAGILLGAGSITAAIMSALPQEPPKSNPNQLANLDVPVQQTPPKKPDPKPPAKVEPKKGPEPKKTVFTEPVVTVAPTPAPAITPANKVIYKLDLTKQAPFKERGRSVLPDKGSTKKWVSDEKAGDGNYPAGWSGASFGDTAIAEHAVRSVDGQMAIGSRTVEGVGGAMLNSPMILAPTGKVTVSFDAMVEATGAQLKVRFAQTRPSKKMAVDVMTCPTAPAGDWKTYTKEFDLKGGSGGFFEFHPGGKGNEFIWIRNFTVVQAGKDTDRPSRTVSMWEVDFKKMKPATVKFDETTDGITSRSIDKQNLPGNLTLNKHRPNISGEYSFADVNGTMALGMRLDTGDTGVQIQAVCGDALSLLSPGDTAQIKVTYRFDGEGAGAAAVQLAVTPYAKFNSQDLVNTGGQWKTIEINFTRPHEGEKYELVLNCGNHSLKKPRATGTIWVKSIEVYPGDDTMPIKK